MAFSPFVLDQNYLWNICTILLLKNWLKTPFTCCVVLKIEKRMLLEEGYVFPGLFHSIADIISVILAVIVIRKKKLAKDMMQLWRPMTFIKHEILQRKNFQSAFSRESSLSIYVGKVSKSSRRSYFKSQKNKGLFWLFSTKSWIILGTSADEYVYFENTTKYGDILWNSVPNRMPAVSRVSSSLSDFWLKMLAWKEICCFCKDCSVIG